MWHGNVAERDPIKIGPCLDRAVPGLDPGKQGLSIGLHSDGVGSEELQGLGGREHMECHVS